MEKAIARIPNWLGDAVMAIPALKALQKRYQLTVLGKKWAAELYDELNFSEILTFGKRGEIPGLLKEKKIELGVLFTNSFSSALLLKLAGVKKLVGYPADLRGFLLSIKVPLPAEKVHQVDYYKTIAKALVSDADEPLTIQISKEKLEKGEKILKKSGFTFNYPIAGINPGAFYGPAKSWFPERFRELAERLKKRGIQIAVFGAEREKEVSRWIAEGTGVSFAGWTSIGDLMSIFPHLDVLITNDSGPMHLANALGIPVVALFGPTDPELTRPYNPGYVLIYKKPPCGPCKRRTCPREKHICMSSIEVEEVEEATLNLLNKRD